MRNPLRLLLVALLLFAGAGVVHAQDRYPIMLEESVRMALEEHGLVRSARAEARAARAAYEKAQSAWWPSISAQAGYTRLISDIPPIGVQFPGIDTSFTLAPVPPNRYRAEISIEYPLFTGFRRYHQTQAAERRAEAAGERVEKQQADVALEVRRAYWTLVQAMARLEALTASLKQVEAYLEDVRNRAEAGAALRRDVLAAKTRRSEVLLQRVKAENAVRAARLRLSELIGVRPGTRLVPTAAVEPQPLAASLETLTENVLNDHPRLDAHRWKVRALKASARAADRQWLPEAALVGRYIYARPNQHFFTERREFHGTLQAGIVLRWDLWNGGRRAAEAAQAQAKLRAAKAQLDYVRSQIKLKIAQRYMAMQGAREAVEVARQAVRAAEETFQVVRQQFEAGAALSADVLEAEAALRSAQAQKREALAAYATARARLLHALGRVWW